MNTGMKNIDWKQYLDTLPDGDPTEWFADILSAFKKQWIDYVDAYLAVQKYSNLGNQFQQAAIDTIKKLKAEDVRQDIVRATVYVETHK